MRSTKLRNRKKKCVHRRHRRIRRRKSNAIVCGVQNEVSVLSLDNMNDVIRVVKTQRVKGKRWWKVMPKDSCEVYKSRKRRHSHDDRRKKEDIDTTDESVIQDENEKHGGKSRKQNGTESDRKVRFRKIKKKRSSEYSSASSTTVSTTSTKSTSSSCLYEMEYE